MEDSTITPPISSSINVPLLSKLDRLDFIMKYLERKTKFEGFENNHNMINNNNNNNNNGGLLMEDDERQNKGFIPMDLALKEVESKGSLVDRVTALETRLFQVKRAIQICLEMDQQSSGTSGGSSSQSRSGESTCSLPTFNNTRISQLHVMTTTHEIEEKCDEEEVDIIPSPPKQKTKKKNKKKNEGKSYQNGKKRNPPTWLHSRLLGC